MTQTQKLVLECPIKSFVLFSMVLYIYWVELCGIGIGIGLKHVYNQDSWYWSWIVSNIKTSLGIGLEKIFISRLGLVLVSKTFPFQDLSWYWSWKKIEIKTSLGIGLERKSKSRQVLVLVLNKISGLAEHWSLWCHDVSTRMFL